MAAEYPGNAGMVIVNTREFTWKAYGGYLAMIIPTRTSPTVSVATHRTHSASISSCNWKLSACSKKCGTATCPVACLTASPTHPDLSRGSSVGAWLDAEP
jgi:hypothetical protein